MAITIDLLGEQLLKVASSLWKSLAYTCFRLVAAQPGKCRGPNCFQRSARRICRCCHIESTVPSVHVGPYLHECKCADSEVRRYTGARSG